MDNNAIIQAEANNIVQTYIRPKPIFTHGKGVYLYDSDGNEYLDFNMGVGPISLGYAYEPVDEAIRRQLADGITFSLVHPLEVTVASS